MVTDKNLSKEEKLEQETSEIVDLYKKRDGQPVVVKKKKTLFDELWERDHPEELKAQKEKELAEQKKKKQEEKEKETMLL